MSMADGTRSAEVVCGVNLPMLLKVATLDRCKLSPTALASEVQECGKRSIRIGSEITERVTPGGKI
jgi:mannose/fructose-specific phosphotransferase system component IIA